jgi:hypothetical protein
LIGAVPTVRADAVCFLATAQHVGRQALGLEAHAHHGRAHELDGVRVGGVEHGHGQLVAGTEALLVHLAQQVAHVHGHVAEVDLDRAGVDALVADRAVVGHVLEFLPVLDGHAAAGLLFVQEGLDQQRGGQDLVARRVQQVGARHVGGAHRLALAAAQAVLDELAMAPMSLCCMISDSWPIRPKLGV